MKKFILMFSLLSMIFIFTHQLEAVNEQSSVQIDRERPENLDVAIVLDRSMSMVGTKINQAANGIVQFLQLMEVNDEVGICCYSNEAETVFDITTIEDADTINDAISSLNTITIFGMTSIGLGIQEGQQVLNGASPQSNPQGMLLLSDGRQNHVPFVGTVLPTIPYSTDIYTIGFGDDCDEYVMNVIANTTNGFYRYGSGADLSAISNEILTEMRSRGFVAKFSGIITEEADDVHEYEFVIDSATEQTVINLMWEHSETNLRFEVINPDGVSLEILPEDAEYHDYSSQKFYRIAIPQHGLWSARVSGINIANDQEDYFLHVSTISELDMDVFFDAPDYVENSPIGVKANLSLGDDPFLSATISAQMLSPTGDYQTIELFDNGNSNDDEMDDGVYGGYFTTTPVTGSYTVTYYASGILDDGSSFTRELTRSTYVNDAPITDSEDIEIPQINDFNLTNYPNPFNPTTQISFNTNGLTDAYIEIYNLRGQLVRTISVNANENPVQTVSWNGTDNNERKVSSGIYMAVLKSGNELIAQKKMVMMK